MKLRAFVACLLFAPAAAAEPCLNVRGPLEPAWSSAVRATERELAGECGAATLTVVPEHSRVVVEMATSDGRRAERLVERPRELVSTALGLLASIPDEPPPSQVASPEPEARASFQPAPVAPIEDRAVTPSLKRDDAERLASLGLTFGTRVGLPSGVLLTDVELRGDVQFNQWVVSLSGRASPSGARLGTHDDWEYGELSVGVAGGRLLRLGAGHLALTVGPRLATTTLETDSQSKSHRDFVLQAAARYIAPFGDRIRPVVAFETEAAPLRIAHSDVIPSWSTSLRFGIVGFGP